MKVKDTGLNKMYRVTLLLYHTGISYCSSCAGHRAYQCEISIRPLNKFSYRKWYSCASATHLASISSRFLIQEETEPLDSGYGGESLITINTTDQKQTFQTLLL